jgi:FMN phosphatase YigB (HAD superfamily)
MGRRPGETGFSGESKMLKTVLLDIDNTLILFDEQAFFQAYFPKIAYAFQDIMPAELFHHRLISSTQALLNNNTGMTNAEYFLQDFSRGMEEKRETFWNRFIRFYETEFDDLRFLVTPTPGVGSVLSFLKDSPVSLVIASNPVWPLLVQKIRLSWAEADKIPFDLITHIENTHSCKPRLDFYRSICQSLGVPPGQCLMVGNDPYNDMVASRIGMKTYLTTDSRKVDLSNLSLSRKIRNPDPNALPVPDFTGSLQNLPETIRLLMA